jgi:DHA2 family multidrug resistance protein
MTTQSDIANRIPITGAMVLATLMNTLDSTIANVALPHIQGSVSASQDQITWVLTSYIIAAAIMTPLSGWLSQKLGRKRMFLFSIAGFTIASMACGLSTNLPEIVIFRLLQGIAGAAMMPLSQTVMLDLFPPRQIPQVMALWSASVVLGPIIGPALGGWLTENASWRWVFFINAPLGALSFLGLLLFMSSDEGGRQRPFDFLGFGGLVMFIGGLQLMLDRGPSQDWFGSTEIWTETVVMIIGLWVFVVQTMTARQPFFHRDLLSDRNFVGTTIFGFFFGALLFGVTAMLPTLMQNLLGYSALQSGYASMPRGVGSFIGFLLMPFLMRRISARLLLLFGIVISLFSLWQMMGFDLLMTSRTIVLAGLTQGLGSGLLFAPMSVLAYVTLDPRHRPEGTTVSTMIRSLGSSVGISVMQATLIRQTSVAHSVLAGRIEPSDPVIRATLPPVMDPTTSLGLQALNGEVTRQGAMIAYDQLFGYLFLATLLLFPLLLFIRPARAAPGVTVEATPE